LSLLSLRSLGVHFHLGDHRTLRAVDNLSLDIEKGEVFGLVGESGCGKSMTALAIMGLLPDAAGQPTGEILFENRNLLGLDPEEMRTLRGNRITMIFQEPMTSLNPVFTVGRQIGELLITHQRLSRRDAIRGAVELLEKVKVPAPGQRVGEYPHQLSGGMRQRVMIAMALACNPSLIIADEPTTALDVTIQAQILELLESLREDFDTSLLFITHDLGVVAETARHVGVMYAGAMMEQAPTGRLFREPLHPYTRGLLDSLPGRRQDRLRPIPGTVPSPDDFPPGCRFAPRCSHRIEECETREPELRNLADGHQVRCIRAEEFLS